MNYSSISDVSIYNSESKTKEDFIKLYNGGIFSDDSKWENYSIKPKIDGIMTGINNPLVKRMSGMSLGIYQAYQAGPKNNLKPTEDMFLVSGFSEIDTTNKIISNIEIEGDRIVSPTLFHNSVHNTPLGYVTIIDKIHNYCLTISDGLSTGESFINYMKYRNKQENSFVVLSGEEYSDFYGLDKTVKKNIYPSYCAFRVTPNTKDGYKIIGTSEKLKDIDLSGYDSIFADKETFLELKKTTDKKIYTDYPIILDNPCSIIFRLDQLTP